ncbi:putative protein phosphatase 2C 8-like, partial [Trifolium medium]|nr:putative protein phosphatase 2C 8-like [Trifolium medium]
MDHANDNNIVADNINKSKEIERRYDDYRKKRKRPSKVAVVPTMESTTGDTATASHGFISVIGRRRVMEDAIKEVKEGRRNDGFDWCKAMCECFMKMDREIGVGGGFDGHVDGNTVGSTAAVVVVGKEEIVVANCGDSRAVLCSG